MKKAYLSSSVWKELLFGKTRAVLLGKLENEAYLGTKFGSSHITFERLYLEFDFEDQWEIFLSITKRALDEWHPTILPTSQLSPAIDLDKWTLLECYQAQNYGFDYFWTANNPFQFTGNSILKSEDLILPKGKKKK